MNYEENDESGDNAQKVIPKVSRVTFDERTGTITLKLASEEEIAANEQRAGNN